VTLWRAWGAILLSAIAGRALVCVNKTASIHDHIGRSRILCVNVLKEKDAHLVQRFRSPDGRARRFEDCARQPLVTGAPALRQEEIAPLVDVDDRFARLRGSAAEGVDRRAPPEPQGRQLSVRIVCHRRLSGERNE
jgi:hypothetical protein